MKGISVICLDDNEAALLGMRDVIIAMNRGFSVRAFAEIADAAAAQRHEPADILACSIRLRSAGGRAGLIDLLNCAAGSVVILIAAEADAPEAVRMMNAGLLFRILMKPVLADEIERSFEEAVAELGLRRRRAISDSTFAAIGQLNVAVAVLDRDHKVVHANAHATAIFEGDALSLGPDGSLRSRDAAETKAFAGFLSRLQTSGSEAPSKPLFFFHRPDHHRAIAVSAVYCPAENGPGGYFSLVFSDPDRKNFTSEDAIRVALNITPSEARVVFGLTEGGSIEEAAELAGVSINTARTYIKSVFSKTGVSRQAELVRLALLSAA